MDDIMVSICCVVYNHEKYLRKCLDGFIMQKCNFKYEVIIHDDASTDSSPEIIREYCEKYPDIFVPILQTDNQFSNNKQIIATIMLPKVRGKYVAICEGDDYWTDKLKLQKQFGVMEANPQCSICVHGVDAITEEGITKDRHYPDINIKQGIINGRKLISIACLPRYEFQTSSYFLRGCVAKAYSNPVPRFCLVAVSDDTPLLLFAGLNGDAFYISDTMSRYRHGSTTSVKASSSFQNDRELFTKHYQHQIDMMNEFDAYTNGKYHKLCKRKIDSYLFFTAWHFQDYKSMAKIKHIRAMKVNQFSTITILKVFLLAMFPMLIKLRRKER